ncbi:hypothetical protein BDB01DRAFT_849494 [Pilobolus umbonatus]|nr:hypothetical protein BDB01DRAFT_849494 [Pilobolus umbonatus]
MNQADLDKESRKHILVNEIKDWNVGVTPLGTLAKASCFVQEAVPPISLSDNNTVCWQEYLRTESEWTNHLIQYCDIYESADIETLESLSICKSIFQQQDFSILDTDVIKSQSLSSLYSSSNAQYHRYHSITTYDVAFIDLSNVQRFTTRFSTAIDKAMKLWSHDRRAAWVRLWYIWNTYGFLWPEVVVIGYKRHDIVSKEDILKNTTSRAKIFEVPYDGIVNYKIIRRLKLRPLHYYFPEEWKHQRLFISNVFYYFSNVIQFGRTITLKNIHNNSYLNRHQLEQALSGNSSQSQHILSPAEHCYWMFCSVEARNTSAIHHDFINKHMLIYHSSHYPVAYENNVSGYDTRIHQLDRTRKNYEVVLRLQKSAQEIMNPRSGECYDHFDLCIQENRCLSNGDFISMNGVLYECYTLYNNSYEQHEVSLINTDTEQYIYMLKKLSVITQQNYEHSVSSSRNTEHIIETTERVNTTGYMDYTYNNETAAREDFNNTDHCAIIVTEYNNNDTFNNVMNENTQEEPIESYTITSDNIFKNETAKENKIEDGVKNGPANDNRTSSRHDLKIDNRLSAEIQEYLNVPSPKSFLEEEQSIEGQEYVESQWFHPNKKIFAFPDNNNNTNDEQKKKERKRYKDNTSMNHLSQRQKEKMPMNPMVNKVFPKEPSKYSIDTTNTHSADNNHNANQQAMFDIKASEQRVVEHEKPPNSDDNAWNELLNSPTPLSFDYTMSASDDDSVRSDEGDNGSDIERTYSKEHNFRTLMKEPENKEKLMLNIIKRSSLRFLFK